MEMPRTHIMFTLLRSLHEDIASANNKEKAVAEHFIEQVADELALADSKQEVVQRHVSYLAGYGRIRGREFPRYPRKHS